MPDPFHPPLAHGLNKTTLTRLMACEPGGYLHQVIPSSINAVSHPIGRSMPSVLQAAVPPAGAGAASGLPAARQAVDPGAAIGFLQGLSEQGVSDVVLVHPASTARKLPFLEQLKRAGDPAVFTMPGADGQTIKGSAYRVGEPESDGSWLLQVDLMHGDKMMSTQLLRMHDVRSSAGDLKEEVQAYARAYESYARQWAGGNAGALAVVCDDGATDSGTGITLMQQMAQSEQRRREAADPTEPRTVPAPVHRRLQEARDRRGPLYAQGQERKIEAGCALLDQPIPADEAARLPKPLEPRRALLADGPIPAGEAARLPKPLEPRRALLPDRPISPEEPVQLRQPTKTRRSPATPPAPAVPVTAKLAPNDASGPPSSPQPLAKRIQSDAPVPHVAEEDVPLDPRYKGRTGKEVDEDLQSRLDKLKEHPDHAGMTAKEKDADLHARLQALTGRVTDAGLRARLEAIQEFNRKLALSKGRSNSAPALNEAALAQARRRALEQAMARRVPSDSNPSPTAAATPLGTAFGSLYGELDQSLGTMQTVKRALGWIFRSKSPDPDQRALATFGPLVAGLKRAHRQLAATAGEGRGPELFVAESMAKVASREFQRLPKPSQERLIDAFQGNDGVLADLRQSRDSLVAMMTKLSKTGPAGTLSRDFRLAAKDHETLNYTIAALEFAVPSRESVTSGPAVPPAA